MGRPHQDETRLRSSAYPPLLSLYATTTARRNRRRDQTARSRNPSAAARRNGAAMRLLPLKRFVETSRPITYGIVQAGEQIDDGVPYIRPIDMTDHDGVREPENLRRTSAEIALAYRRSTVHPGDIIVTIGPSFGKTMIVP